MHVYMVDMTIFAFLIMHSYKLPILAGHYLFKVRFDTVLNKRPIITLTPDFIRIFKHYTLVARGSHHVLELLRTHLISSVCYTHNKIAFIIKMSSAPKHFVVWMSNYHKLISL